MEQPIVRSVSTPVPAPDLKALLESAPVMQLISNLKDAIAYFGFKWLYSLGSCSGGGQPVRT
jgi:hypothetical protein